MKHVWKIILILLLKLLKSKIRDLRRSRDVDPKKKTLKNRHTRKIVQEILSISLEILLPIYPFKEIPAILVQIAKTIILTTIVMDNHNNNNSNSNKNKF